MKHDTIRRRDQGVGSKMIGWKYGILFSTAGVLFLVLAIVWGGVVWACVWPALSFGVVGAGYLGLGPAIFGKRADGSLRGTRIALLAPFLFYTWGVWHLVRTFSQEPAYNTLVGDWLIGRRLLAHELPQGVTRVVDLTAEFAEPRAIRQNTDYHCLAVLDGFVPSDEVLAGIVDLLRSNCSGKTFIHCAQGHGRTGIFAVAVLTFVGAATNADEALHMLQQARPLAKLSSRQRQYVKSICTRLQDAVNSDREGSLDSTEH